MLTDTTNPSFTKQQLLNKQKQAAKKDFNLESEPSKIMSRIYDKYIKVSEQEMKEIDK